MYYSDEREDGLLYLYDRSWVQDDGSYTELGIHGLFLVEKGTIESIEFTHITADTAEEQSAGSPPASAD